MSSGEVQIHYKYNFGTAQEKIIVPFFLKTSKETIICPLTHADGSLTQNKICSSGYTNLFWDPQKFGFKKIVQEINLSANFDSEPKGGGLGPPRYRVTSLKKLNNISIGRE